MCGEGWLNGVRHEGFISVVKLTEVKVFVKCVQQLLKLCNSLMYSVSNFY
jgi:hypothetical protein